MQTWRPWPCAAIGDTPPPPAFARSRFRHANELGFAVALPVDGLIALVNAPFTARGLPSPL